MKIGVVSDTHSRAIPKELISDFKDVELIVHAGDFCSFEDFKIFSSLKEIKAVSGNMDELKLCQTLPKKIIFQWNGFSIGVYHGHGLANKVLDSVKEEFKKDKVDAIIFGHSHVPFNERIGDILYFNPGSPNDLVIAPFCSYGFLEIVNNKLFGRIIKIKNKHG